MHDLVPFQFDTHAVNIHVDDDGNPWWVLQDVCAALGIADPSQVASRLRPHESTITYFTQDGIPRRLLLVNESGLYRVIMRSNKPEAERFQDWVFGEVLPQIRKTGQYAMSPTVLPTRDDDLTYLRNHVAFLTEIGMLEHRDKLMLADMARNLLTKGALTAFPSPGEQLLPAMPFFVADRVKALGYCLTRQQEARIMPSLGRRIAKEYRERTGEDPHQSARFVDGAVRPVNVYSIQEVEWIDAIVQVALAGVNGDTGEVL